MAEGQRPKVVIAVVAVVAVILASGGVTQLIISHGSGDPNGTILARLDPVMSAVPPQSTVARQETFEPVWQSACFDNPEGRSGWWFVELGVEFRSRLSPTVVVSDFNHALQRLGWSRYYPGQDSYAGAGADDVLENKFQGVPLLKADSYAVGWMYWARSVPGAKTVDAALTPMEGGGWFLGADAEPPGFAVPGC